MTETELEEIKVYYDRGYNRIEKIYYIDSNGLKQGDYREYYFNGSPKLRTTMVDDKAHGKFIEWYKNEHDGLSYYEADRFIIHDELACKHTHDLKLIWGFNHGKRHGKLVMYKKDGSENGTAYFKDGEEVKEEELRCSSIASL